MVLVSLARIVAFCEILVCQRQHLLNCVQFKLSGGLCGSVITRRIAAIVVNIRFRPLPLIAIWTLRRTAQGWIAMKCGVLRTTRKQMDPGIQLSCILRVEL